MGATRGKRLPPAIEFSIGRLDDDRVGDIWDWMIANGADKSPLQLADEDRVGEQQ